MKLSSETNEMKDWGRGESDRKEAKLRGVKLVVKGKEREIYI